MRTAGSFRSSLALLLLLAPGILVAEAVDYPLIQSLSADDLLFRQIESDVEAYHYAEAHRQAGALAPSLTVYRYRLGPTDNIAAVAARLNTTQATLATWNRVSSPDGFRALSEVLVANIPGVFVPDTPSSELEQTLAGSRRSRSQEALPVVVSRPGLRVSGRFYAGEDFSSLELLRFYRAFFRDPIRTGYVSSRFGVRRNPFGSGSSFHAGVDVAAPRGTPVVAAQSGRVTEIGSSGRYGNYAIVVHDSCYQTMYAHLDAVSVGLQEWIESGTMVGTVGDSGLTTGTHLHFEIRFGGVAVDPLLYLPAKWSRG